MAANSRGQMRPHQASRTPSFIVIGLLVVIAILGFNYWNISSKNNVLSNEMVSLTERIRLASVKKTAVEKRNDALMQKVRESEQELTRQKSLFAKKEDEVSNANEQCKGKSQELEVCKSESTKYRDDAENCHQTEQDLSSKLKTVEDLKAACDKQLDEAKKCQDQNQPAQDKVGCTAEKQAYAKLIHIVKHLWGGSALVKLHQAGVDVSPVIDPSQLQNMQGQNNNPMVPQGENAQAQQQGQQWQGQPGQGQPGQGQPGQGQQGQGQQGQGQPGQGQQGQGVFQTGQDQQNPQNQRQQIQAPQDQGHVGLNQESMKPTTLGNVFAAFKSRLEQKLRGKSTSPIPLGRNAATQAPKANSKQSEKREGLHAGNETQGAVMTPTTTSATTRPQFGGVNDSKNHMPHGDAANQANLNSTAEDEKMNISTPTSSAFETKTPLNTTGLLAQAPQQPPQNQQLAPPQGAAGVNGVAATPGHQQAAAMPQPQEGIAQGGAQDRYQQRQAEAQAQQQGTGNSQLGRAGGDRAGQAESTGGPQEHRQSERYGPAEHDDNGARGHEMENPVPPKQQQDEPSKQAGDKNTNDAQNDASNMKAPLGQVGEKAPLGSTMDQIKKKEQIPQETNGIKKDEGLPGGLKPGASQEGGKAAELDQKQSEIAPDSRQIDDPGAGKKPLQYAPEGQVPKPRVEVDDADRKKGHALGDVEKTEDNIDRMNQRFRDRARS